MKDLIQWAAMSADGQKVGWIVMGVLMLSLVWIHLMWFFKRPMWKKISNSSLFAVYLFTVIAVTTVSLVMTGIISVTNNSAINGNPILVLYMFVAAPIMLIALLINGYNSLLKIRNKIPEA